MTPEEKARQQIDATLRESGWVVRTKDTITLSASFQRVPRAAEAAATACPNVIDRIMTDDVMQTAMTSWAAKDLPARLLAAQVAKLLNCTTDDMAILISTGKLWPLGRPNPNAVKFFSAVELIALLADRDWLEEATKTIEQYWRRKNARRNGMTFKRQTDDTPEMAANSVKSLSTIS